MEERAADPSAKGTASRIAATNTTVDAEQIPSFHRHSVGDEPAAAARTRLAAPARAPRRHQASYHVALDTYYASNSEKPEPSIKVSQSDSALRVRRSRVGRKVPAPNAAPHGSAVRPVMLHSSSAIDDIADKTNHPSLIDVKADMALLVKRAAEVRTVTSEMRTVTSGLPLHAITYAEYRSPPPPPAPARQRMPHLPDIDQRIKAGRRRFSAISLRELLTRPLELERLIAAFESPIIDQAQWVNAVLSVSPYCSVKESKEIFIEIDRTTTRPPMVYDGEISVVQVRDHTSQAGATAKPELPVALKSRQRELCALHREWSKHSSEGGDASSFTEYLRIGWVHESPAAIAVCARWAEDFELWNKNVGTAARRRQPQAQRVSPKRENRK